MDTNFLMAPYQFNVDIYGELHRLLDVNFDILVPDKVMDELETMAKCSRGSKGRAAKLALKLSKAAEVIGAGGSDPDEAILSLVDGNTVVCTNDKALRKKVIARGGRAIYVRQKRYLDMEGGAVGLS